MHHAGLGCQGSDLGPAAGDACPCCGGWRRLAGLSKSWRLRMSKLAMMIMVMMAWHL